MLGRAVVPGAVVAVLAAGVGVAVWPDQSAETAEAQPGPNVATAPVVPTSTAVPAALRSDRPDRSTQRSALPSGSAKPSSASSAENSAEQNKKREPKPKALETLVGKVVGSRYARVDVRLRLGAGTDFSGSAVLKTGQKISVTDQRSDGWTQVLYRGDGRWVKTSNLTSSKPAKSKSAAKSASSTGSGGISSGACAGGSSVERGLTPDAIKVHRAICAAFPQVKSYGGVRADSLPEHPSGRALDAMISSSSTGWQIARWVQAHRKELGVSQILYAQKIWTVQRSSEGWRSFPDRGSVSANHYDHVHVTVYGNAAS